MYNWSTHNAVSTFEHFGPRTIFLLLFVTFSPFFLWLCIKIQIICYLRRGAKFFKGAHLYWYSSTFFQVAKSIAESRAIILSFQWDYWGLTFIDNCLSNSLNLKTHRKKQTQPEHIYNPITAMRFTFQLSNTKR